MEIKQAIKKIIPTSLLEARRCAKADRVYRHDSALSSEEYPAELSRWFHSRTGEELELENPKTFNQKIQRMKLYDSTPEKGRLADKYLVREWVAERIGEKYLVPLLGVWGDPDDIDFNALPDRFVLKCTHGCGWNVIVSDKSRLDLPATKKKLKKWLAIDWSYTGGLELHYHYCEPRIIAEQFLENDQGSGAIFDYKVYCFNNGEPIILACKDREGGHATRTGYYDPCWKRLPFSDAGIPVFECPRPEHLDEMLTMSLRLAEGFSFVRVDWYESKGQLWFGEMTFTSASGGENFDPPDWNLEFGRRIDLGD